MSQPDQRAKHLDEAERRLGDRAMGTIRYEDAIRHLIQHLRSLPSEPKVETLGADEAARFMSAHAHPPGALDLTVEEVEALRYCVARVTGLTLHKTTQVLLAQDALRKLNARAGSEGAKAENPQCQTCSGTGKIRAYNFPATRECPTCQGYGCFKPKDEPAASETAKCTCVWGAAEHPYCAMHDYPPKSEAKPAASETAKFARNAGRAESQADLYRANERVEDYKRALESEKEGRAESEQRVRELEALLRRALSDWFEEESTWINEASELLGDGRNSKLQAADDRIKYLERQLATLKAEKEAAEARVRELTRDMGLQREFWNEAQLRVEAWEPVVRIAVNWQHNDENLECNKPEECTCPRRPGRRGDGHPRRAPPVRYQGVPMIENETAEQLRERISAAEKHINLYDQHTDIGRGTRLLDLLREALGLRRPPATDADA